MIYFDHNATTPVLPEVLEAMMPYCSLGASCLTDSDDPSHLIEAMKRQCNVAQRMILFLLDVSNPADEIKPVLVGVQRATDVLRPS